MATLEEWMHYARSPARRVQIGQVHASALAGWQALDLGRPGPAWTHFETANAAAREADDDSLLAWATAEQAYVLVDVGRAEEGAELARAAQAEADHLVPGLLRCWLGAVVAEISAAAGDRLDQSRRSLAAAVALLPADALDTELPYVSLGPVHMARWTGHVLARLGDDEAIRNLECAAAGMSDEFTRAKAGLHTDLALALRRVGDLGESDRHAGIAAELATRSGSVRQRRRLLALAC